MEIFLGTAQERLEYYQKKGVDVSELEKAAEEKDKRVNEVTGKITLDVEKLGDLTEEELRNLNRARHFHDPTEVLMQSDVSFYDRFYSDNTTDELTLAVHKIRRIYRDYRDYCRAMYLREQYLERLLEEEFGGDLNMYQVSMSSDDPPYWVPPKPIYASKKDVNANELDLFNMESLCSEEINEEDLSKTLAYLKKDYEGIYLGSSPGDGIYSDVCTDLSVIKYVDSKAGELYEQEDRYAKSKQSITDQFNSIISSWYQEDKKTDDIGEDRLFYYAPEKIRERYYQNLSGIEFPDNIEEIMDDPDWFEKDHTDWDEMVYDPNSNKPMTRREFQKRQIISTLGKCGWGELRLMELMDVGSRYERKKLGDSNRARRRKNKLKPETLALQEQRMFGNQGNRYDDNTTSYEYYDVVLSSYRFP